MGNGQTTDGEGQQNQGGDEDLEGSQQASSSGSQGSGEPGGDQGTAPTDVSTGGQTGFTHPLLRDKSPAEIEQLVSSFESAVREQGTELNQLYRQMNQGGRQEPTGTGPAPTQEPSNEDFFSRPVDAVRSLIQQQLSETVAPLRQEIQQFVQSNQVEAKRQQYRQRWPDWDRYEPFIQNAAASRGLSMEQILSDEGVAEIMYRAVRDMQRERGNGPQPQPQNQPPRNQQVNPQHRPSSSPLPQQNKQPSGGTRELTENERILARQYGMSPAEYIQWQDAQPEEVLSLEVNNG